MNVAVSGTEITGTLKYVTGYTGFSSDKPAEQEGNFLALNIRSEPSDAVTTVELVGGDKGPVTVKPDGKIVLRITNKASQKVKVTATKDKTVKTITYGLTGLTLTPKMG